MANMMSQERYEFLNTQGDYNKFINEMVENTSLEYKDIIKFIPGIINNMRYESHKEVFRLYFFSKCSIINIHFMTGLSYTRIEKYLESSKMFIQKELKMYAQN